MGEEVGGDGREEGEEGGGGGGLMLVLVAAGASIEGEAVEARFMAD